MGILIKPKMALICVIKKGLGLKALIVMTEELLAPARASRLSV
jgi:hypothetical protein